MKAEDDEVSVFPGTTASIPVTMNDRTSATGARLDYSSIRLLDASGNAVSEVVTNGGRFSLANPGMVSFTPKEGFTGKVDAVTYEIKDTAGNRGTAQIKVTVGTSAPTVNPPSGLPTTPVASNPIQNNPAPSTPPRTTTGTTQRVTTSTQTSTTGVPADSGLKYYDSDLAKTGSDTGNNVLLAAGSAIAGGAALLAAGLLSRRRERGTHQ